MALAATGGVVTLIRQGGSSFALKSLAASVIFSACLLLPYRLYEIRTLVKPLALTSHYLETRPCDFVILETSNFWYSWDLIRNDPWLKERPLIFDGSKLSPAQREALFQKGKVLVIGADEVEPFGVILSDPAKAYLSPK
jgi:hypothetical protein